MNTKMRLLQWEHVVFISFCVALYLLDVKLGNDFYLHLAAGELLDKTGKLPLGDVFSFTETGKPWVLHEWLFELMLYKFNAVFGVYGVKFVSAVILTASVYIMFRASRKMSVNSAVSVLLASASMLFVVAYNTPRPQIITYLFVSVYLYVLLAYKYKFSRVSLYLLPAVMLVWVNIHGGYIVGLALVVLFSICHILDEYFIEQNVDSAKQSARMFFTIITLCILASLINPYGYQHLLFPFKLMSMSSMRFIAEWASPDFHIVRFEIYLGFIMGYFLIRSMGGRRFGFVETVIPIIFVAESFVSRRHIPLAILVLMPFYVVAIVEAISKFKNSRWMNSRFSAGFFHVLDREIVASSNHGYVYRWLFLVLVISVGVYLDSCFPKRIEQAEWRVKPVYAINFMKKKGLVGDVFGRYAYGGYLLYELYPKVKVFIDGRLDFYGDRLFENYRYISRAEMRWHKAIDRYPIDFVLMRNNVPLTFSLEHANDFKLIYRDIKFSLFVANNAKHKKLIEKLGDKYILKKKHL